MVPRGGVQLSCYIHCNPLRAGLAEDLLASPWSSYSAYVGSATKPEWLNCDYVLGAIARRNARASIRQFGARLEEDGELRQILNITKLDLTP